MYLVYGQYPPLHHDVNTGEPIMNEKFVVYDTRLEADEAARGLKAIGDVLNIKLYTCKQIAFKE
jgi:hypothetical protein